jgi:ABC-type molybdate transport system substrate-binding protein
MRRAQRLALGAAYLPKAARFRNGVDRMRARAAHLLRAAAVAAALLCFATLLAAATPLPAAPPHYQGRLFPPWSGGKNDPARYKGLQFTVPEIDDMPDFHGNLTDPKLVLYIGGNCYFAMAPLVAAFSRLHPQYAGRTFYVTIPPGLLVRAMRLHDTFTSGNMTFTVRPDVFDAGAESVAKLVRDATLHAPEVQYARNDLTIMVPKGNPGHISSLRDLGRPGVRVVMPNPAYEGVVRQINIALERAGGAGLVNAVYGTKVRDGETVLTHIHHRQTPLFLMQHIGVAGVTWESEAMFLEQSGHAISNVAIPASQNVSAVYGAAAVTGAPHPRAAAAWLRFLRTPEALRILERYGFTPAFNARAR